MSTATPVMNTFHRETVTLLDERETTHGSFESNASISQRIKRHFDDKTHLTPVQRESLDLIATKLSRILSGQSNFPGHWEDIAGYAKLAQNEAEQMRRLA